jgi:DNA-binding LacI/PurR family transcriptional regulator
LALFGVVNAAHEDSMSRTPKGSPGIKDVAKAAGVSVATASRVVAKADYPVAQETRQRVLVAARQLNFVPNALARGLARSRTDTIGVVVPGILNPYYAAMVEAIDRAARERGLTVLLGLTGGDEARREAIVDELVGRRVDGLIVCAGAQDHLAGRTPEALGIPAVLIGEQANAGFPIIKTDNRKAGREAAEYLWSLGHRRFIYLTSLKSWHDFHDRGQGMLAFLKRRDERYEVAIYDDLFGEADAYRRISQACSEGLTATAILASTDRHALGALAALSDAGRAVPDSVSVMGFDDYVTSGYIRPSLTTMQMPAAEMGRRAIALLDDILRKQPVSQKTLLNAVLVERASTAKVRTRGGL